MVNNAVMQFVDRAYLARYSMEALDAVLPAGVLAWIFMGFFQSVVGYSGVFVAQCHGAGDIGMCKVFYRAAIIISVAAGILMMPLIPLGDWIIAVSAPAGRIAEMERTYYNILLLGGFFVCGQMASSSFFTGRGKTRTVFWVNVAGNLINIALDPFLIFGWCGLPEMGIAGAAWATVISMAVQWLILFVAAYRVRVSVPADCGYRRAVFQTVRYGIPAGFYELLNMASFTVFVFVTGTVGEIELAASNACFTVNYLLFAPMMGFAIGAQTLVGQARGRGDDAEAFAVLKRTLQLALAMVAVAVVLTLVFHRQVLGIFAPADMVESAQFHRTGKVLMIIMATWMLFDAADIIYAGALKGAGDSRFVMWWMSICALGLWLPSVFAVKTLYGTMPAVWSTMVGYVLVICVGSVVRWHGGSWRKIRLLEER